eukprot:233152_1
MRPPPPHWNKHYHPYTNPAAPPYHDMNRNKHKHDMDSNNHKNINKKKYRNCDHFIMNGEILLQITYAVLLRGMNLLSSNLEDKKQKMQAIIYTKPFYLSEKQSRWHCYFKDMN